jgi:hypothetical protein
VVGCRQINNPRRNAGAVGAVGAGSPWAIIRSLAPPALDEEGSGACLALILLFWHLQLDFLAVTTAQLSFVSAAARSIVPAIPVTGIVIREISTQKVCLFIDLEMLMDVSSYG